MIPISKLVEKIRKAFGAEFELRYLHPSLYLVISTPAFNGLNEEARNELFIARCELQENADIFSKQASTISLVLVTPDERRKDYDFLDVEHPGEHWLAFLDQETGAWPVPVECVKPRAVHFYGYKGGQARTTILAMLGQQLADDGYRVLAVDCDLEAPSLDVFFGVQCSSLSGTLLGLEDKDSPVETISAYVPAGRGLVDMLACRPASREYDLNFASFVLRSTLDVVLLETIVRRIHQHAAKPIAEGGYDFVLFDHRSGLTTSVLPVIKAYPGPSVICLRLDEQSSAGASLFDILLGRVKGFPGAYVSFSLDPEDTRNKMLSHGAGAIDTLLYRLGVAMNRGDEIQASSIDAVSPEELQRFWISWIHDRAFINNRLPEIKSIVEDNRNSLNQLREVLGMSGPKALEEDSVTTPEKENTSIVLSPSGASDEGPFIETPELARLFQANTPITYIFGRKGTGKTRILKELQSRNLGEALIVAADERSGGLSTAEATFSDLALACREEPEKLWWAILAAGLRSQSTSSTEFRDNLRVVREQIDNQGLASIRLTEIAALAANQVRRRVFLIDGIETAFRASDLIKHVEVLFKFLLTIQSDSQFANRVIVRLCLRSDLSKRAFQNVEQQTSGRKLDLTWNTQSIFNFVLSRIVQLEWFSINFASTCAKIRKMRNRINNGLVPPEEYEPLLLEIFPRDLRRNHLQTLTFLKTYFSDAAGEEERRASFYPRLFDAFLGFIANRDQLPPGMAPVQPLEKNRVHQALVLAAHEASSRQFLNEVAQELSVLLDLEKQPEANTQRVNELLQAFDGLRTPFALEECLTELSTRLPGVEVRRLREALTLMKEVGMFEDRPGYSGWWRAGRLFKSALRMKYVR